MQVKQSRFMLMLLAIIAGGVLFLLLSGFACQYQMTQTDKLQKVIDKQQQTIKMMQDKIAHREEFAAKRDDLNLRLSVLDENLTDYRYMPTYLTQMQEKTKRTGNTILSIRPNEIKPLDPQKSPFALNATPAPDASGDAQVQPTEGTAPAASSPAYMVECIDMSVQGEYSNVVQLLDQFRKFPKMVYVQTVDLEPLANDERSTVVARLHTYAIISPEQYRRKTAQTAAHTEAPL